MISKILVAIDHTDSSQHALQQASLLARSEKSQLLLQSVVPAYEGDLRMMGRSEVLEEMRNPYQEALEKAVNTAREFNLSTRSFLDEGEPFARILSLAEKENVDLIVVNKDRHFPIDRIPIGESASKVISRSEKDILVVPEKSSLRLDSILLAYDKTEASQKALKRAIDLTVAYGSELTIMTAFEVPLEGFSYSPDLWDKDVKTAKKQLEQASDIAREAGVRHIKSVLRHGKASQQICKLATEINAGLIVLGCRSVHAVKKVLHGNVVDNVVRNDAFPVWIAKV
jgi:nucleotide-binding universal stress UspA family protein